MEQERRHSEREWFNRKFNDIEGLIREDRLPMSEQFRILGEKLDAQAEVLAIPVRDIPTVEELLAQAKTDNSKRELLQRTLAEMEFESVEVEYP